MSETALTTELRETFDSGRIDPKQIDRENGWIRGIRALGEKSRNKPPFNHLYPRATREAAIALIEGAKVNANHQPRESATETRPVQDGLGLGYLCNVREDGNGLRADWRFNPKSRWADDICWEAEHNPNGLAFSINGHSEHKRRTDNGTVVEAIDSISSVDLVSKGATTNGLFEHEIIQPRRFMSKKVSLLIEELAKPRPGYAKALREMAESGVLSPDSSYDEGAMGSGCYPAGKGPLDPEGQAVDHEQAIYDAAKAFIDDGTLKVADKIAKIKKLLGVVETPQGGKGGADVKPEDAKKAEDDKKAEESRKAAQGNNLVESLKLQLQVRDLCADEKVAPSKVLRKALDGCATLQEAKEVLAAHKAETTALEESAKAAAVAALPGGAKSAAGNGQQVGKNGDTAVRESKTDATPPKAWAPPADADKARAERAALLRRG